MPTPPPPPEPVPKRIFTRRPGVPEGPFYDLSPKLATGAETGEIGEEEIRALARIIRNAYLEWKRQ